MPTQTVNTSIEIDFSNATWAIAPGVIVSDWAIAFAANSVLVNYGSIITPDFSSVVFAFGAGGRLYNEESGIINGRSGVDVSDGVGVSIRNRGEIFGVEQHGIHVRNSGDNVTITNTATGEIFGALGGVTASSGGAQHVTIKNAGLIDSEQHGIWLLNATGAAPVIVNSGTISGTVNAILAESGDRLNVDNSGQLIGNVRGTSTNQVDTVANTGTIKGSVFLGSGSDRYTGVATVDDTLVSGKVSGTVFGEAGNDRLTGGNSVDRFNGGTGNDTLNAGAGNDTLIGGTGKDILTGGTGKDFFLFNTALSASTNVDTITDFQVNVDKIQLENAIFTAVGTSLTASEFVANASGAATNGSQHILYDTTDGRLFYDVDGNGGQAKVHFATLKAGLALDHLDFLVI
jgi:Ca2+-binding RTX toxin-like protein